MFVVDANILLYAADHSSAAHTPCRQLLERWRTQATAWYLTWGVCYEFLRVSTHPKVFNKPWPIMELWKFIAALLTSPSLGILTETDRHEQVALQTLDEVPLLAGNLVHDARPSSCVSTESTRSTHGTLISIAFHSSTSLTPFRNRRNSTAKNELGNRVEHQPVH